MLSNNIDISRFANKRILIIGDIMLDEFVETRFVKNSPEYAEMPILNIEHKKYFLGGAANVALNIKKLKAIPYLVGTVGDDNSSKIIYELLHQAAITNQYVFTNYQQKTTTKTRVFQDSKPIGRLDIDAQKSAINDVVNQFLLKNITDAIVNQKPHAVILQDYNKGVLNPFVIEQVLQLAKKHSLPICVDPKFDNWHLYQNVDLIKPNKLELFKYAEQLTNVPLTIQEIAQKLRQTNSVKNILVTLGAEGNYILNDSIDSFEQLSQIIENPDVCGAGDTVIAVATLALLIGTTLEEIADLANRAGYWVCTKKYIYPISLDELQNIR